MVQFMSTSTIDAASTPVAPSRVAFYARVSSDQQAQAGTIASQVATIEERIAQDGLHVEEQMRFIDDGFTGATVIRPALERLRDLAAAGGIDRLYVLCPDRLARRYAHQMLLVDELQRCGVELVFINHDLGKTPEDHLLLQVQGMVAEYERAKILERSRRGKLHAAKSGRISVLSNAPYGYRYLCRDQGSGTAMFNVHMEEAAVVRRIYQWVGQDRLSIGEVCRRLKSQRIPSPKGKDYWDRSSVWALLKNPAYIGQAAFGKTRQGPPRHRLRAVRNGHEHPRGGQSDYDQPRDQWITIAVPQLVEEKLFQSVTEQLDENRRRNRQGRRGAKYLLQGLLACGCCGYAYYGKPVSPAGRKGHPRSYVYYRCVGSDAYRFGGQRVCHNKQTRQDILDELVWQDVCNLLSDPQRLTRELERRLQRGSNTSDQEQQHKLRNTITQVQRGIARIIDAYSDGLISKAEFEPRVTTAKERLARLQSELKSQVDQEAQARDLRLVVDNLETFARQIAAGLDQADWNAKRDVIRTLVKRVELHQEQLKVVYRVDTRPFDSRHERGVLHYCWRRERPTLRHTFLRRNHNPILQHTGV